MEELVMMLFNNGRSKCSRTQIHILKNVGTAYQDVFETLLNRFYKTNSLNVNNGN
jgi:hypothetical protein